MTKFNYRIPPKCVCGGYHVVRPDLYIKHATAAYDEFSSEEQEAVLVLLGKPPVSDDPKTTNLGDHDMSQKQPTTATNGGLKQPVMRRHSVSIRFNEEALVNICTAGESMHPDDILTNHSGIRLIAIAAWATGQERTARHAESLLESVGELHGAQSFKRYPETTETTSKDGLGSPTPIP